MTAIARRRASSRGGPRGRTRGALDIAISREPGVRAPTTAVVTSVVGLVLRAEGVRRAMLSVTFVGNRMIRQLNAKHLRKNRLTDVIAFTLAGADGRLVGDVYVAPDIARVAAAELGIPAREEILRLVVHGVLHVLGFDHPEGGSRVTSEMWLRQESLLRRALVASTR